MPNLEEHCKHTMKRFNVEGRDIHQWLDEPSRVYGGTHREFRHDEQTIITVGKVFDEQYGSDIAQAIALDHIIADHEEAIKKRSENKEELTELKIYKEEKPKYKKKRRELTHLIKDTIGLPEIKTRSMRDYLDTVYSHLGTSSQYMAEVSLRHWQKYLLSRDNSNEVEIKDITRFISALRSHNVSIITIANYLGQLVGYFNHENQPKLANYTNEQKKKLQRIGRSERKVVPIRVKDLINLYKHSDSEDKVLIRLLLFQDDIPISNLPSIKVTQDLNGKYKFIDDIAHEEVSIDETIVKIAEPLMKKNKSKLLSFNSDRTLDEHIHDLAERVDVGYKIYAKTLRQFGRNVNHDDLVEWLASA